MYGVKKRRMKKMAKPIEASIILKGNDAKRFLNAMKRKENTPITKKELKMVEAIKRIEPLYNSCDIL